MENKHQNLCQFLISIIKNWNNILKSFNVSFRLKLFSGEKKLFNKVVQSTYQNQPDSIQSARLGWFLRVVGLGCEFFFFFFFYSILDWVRVIKDLPLFLNKTQTLSSPYFNLILISCYSLSLSAVTSTPILSLKLNPNPKFSSYNLCWFGVMLRLFGYKIFRICGGVVLMLNLIIIIIIIKKNCPTRSM